MGVRPPPLGTSGSHPRSAGGTDGDVRVHAPGDCMGHPRWVRFAGRAELPLAASTPCPRPPQRIRVLVADDEPALRGPWPSSSPRRSGSSSWERPPTRTRRSPSPSGSSPTSPLLDVKMPAGGGPRAAREIQRLSPGTRVIALSAFEDRPTVLEMLRAGCVGYLVKGTAAEDILGSIRRVAQGGTSLSDEVVGGIVHELSSQLRREEIEQEQLEARRDGSSGSSRAGMSMAFQPIVNLEDHDVIGVEALARFRSFPDAPARRVVRRGCARSTSACNSSSRRSGRRALGLPKLPPRSYLSVNCSHRAARSPELRSDPRAGRRTDGRGDHGARGRRRLRRARAVAGAAPRARRTDRDRRCRRRVREPATHAADRARHREGRHLAHPLDRRRPRQARARDGR